MELKLKSTRDAYGDSLIKFGDNENIVVLDADLSKSTQTHKFAKLHGDRFFNCGCAEQNMIGIAAGLALSGKIVLVSTYSMFLLRAWEQIRNTICHDSLNVKFCVSHSGLTNSVDGASHQCLEDISLMRVIPGMTVINPCDAIETEKAIENEIERKGPCYIRLNREATPIIYDEKYENKNRKYRFELGKAVKLRGGNDSGSDNSSDIGIGNDLGIIATGTMVHKALEVADILEKDRIYCTVLNMHTIKPVGKDTIDMIVKLGKDTEKIVTMEEHSIIGGLGGTVSEILSKNYPIPIDIIGIDDMFGESGTYEQLLDKHGLSTEKIVKRIQYRFFGYETTVGESYEG